MMKKIEGIKSVDFKIKAVGEGVVNWNGSTELEILIKGEYKKVNKNNNLVSLFRAALVLLEYIKL